MTRPLLAVCALALLGVSACDFATGGQSPGFGTDDPTAIVPDRNDPPQNEEPDFGGDDEEEDAT